MVTQNSKTEAFLTIWKKSAIAPSVYLILLSDFMLTKQLYGYEILKVSAVATSLTTTE